MPDVPLPPQEPLPQSDIKKADGITLLVVIAALYRLNILTRIQVRDFLDMVKKEKLPPDITDYLIKEVAKI